MAIFFAYTMAMGLFAANAIYPYRPLIGAEDIPIALPEEPFIEEHEDLNIPTLEQLLSEYPGFDEDEDAFDENSDVVDMEIDETSTETPTIIVTIVRNTTATE